jgi:hypothetical protein
MRRSLLLALAAAGAACVSLIPVRPSGAGEPEARATYRAEYGDVLCVAFAPDGKALAVAGGPEVKLWDITTAKPERK